MLVLLGTEARQRIRFKNTVYAVHQCLACTGHSQDFSITLSQMHRTKQQPHVPSPTSHALILAIRLATDRAEGSRGHDDGDDATLFIDQVDLLPPNFWFYKDNCDSEP